MARRKRNSGPIHTGIAVIESKWWHRSNVSVRGLVELISDIYCGNPNAYHYEMINSEAAAKEAIPRIGKLRHCKILSIASHGSKNNIDFMSEEKLSRTELKNALKLITGSRLVGLHLGACSVGSSDFANYLFAEGVQLTWIAGYKRDVSWIDSSALDLLFFNEMLKKHRGGNTHGKLLYKVAERLTTIAGGLATELGFGLYTRKPGSGEARNLLTSEGR